MTMIMIPLWFYYNNYNYNNYNYYIAGIFKYLDGNHGEVPTFTDGIQSISKENIVKEVLKLSRLNESDIIL